jgi:glycosyltransferase involved in cell wall biosynthesis
LRVSTVIAAYNAERTIAQTLDSALAQKCAAHEIIVVNDGSTDSTAEVLAKYNGLIRVVHQSNRGQGAARNIGVAAAKGRFIAFLDADDLWLPGKLNTMVGALEQNPSASLAFSEYSAFGDGGMEYGISSLGHSFSRQELMETSLPPILTSTWVLPKNTFVQSGGFCDAFQGRQGYEDSWLLLALSELGEFVYVPEPFTRYRISEKSENADKYAPGLSIFLSLARARYGRRSRALRRNARDLHCRFLQSKLAHQIDRGQHSAAFSTLARMVRLRPAYLVKREFIRRLLLPQNIRRVQRLVYWRSSVRSRRRTSDSP